ncbi:hypothetical protein CHARACLAT_013573 [Characodon lateralis]|uniref:Uncharacterized protein n=1 Tax=Characodon lateralis TaxID=208331 RepID=A0ABU7E9J1_9TELE|nr:hypothetical protein [Characodon lateralis]
MNTFAGQCTCFFFFIFLQHTIELSIVNFLPATPPAGGWYLCPLLYLWFLVSGAGRSGVCWLFAGAWSPGLCLASAWGVKCPGVLGLWVHGWICSSVDGCRRSLWALCCSSLELLHCGCWVDPLVELGGSPVLLWGVAVVPAVVLMGFLCSGGPLDGYGSDLLHICPGSRGAGLWLLTLAIAYFYGETLHTQTCSHSDPQVFRFRC